MSTGTGISKLNEDVLYIIFLINTSRVKYGTEFFPFFPLTNLRHCSQVCVQWRTLLLQAPALWARCINLDVLDQETNNWRKLVVERTGTAPVTISCSHGMEGYTDRLFMNTLWSRTVEVDVWVTSGLVNIMDVFSQPTEAMRIFHVRGNYYRVDFTSDDDEDLFLLGRWSYTRNTIKRVNLFSGYAPNLQTLEVTSHDGFIMTIDFQHGRGLLNSNMRHLILGDNIKTTPSDLYMMCTQMPFLESLYVEVSKDGQSTERPRRRLDMVHLTSIKIESRTFAVYPDFLRNITTSSACRLDMHHVDSTEQPLDSWLTCMKEIYSHFSQLAYSSLSHSAPRTHKTELVLCSNGGCFTAYDSHLVLWIFNNISDWRTHFSVIMTDVFASLTVPDNEGYFCISSGPGKTFDLNTNQQTALNIATHRLLSSTSKWVKILEASPDTLQYLDEISGDSSLFPALKQLYIEASDSSDSDASYFGHMLSGFASRDFKALEAVYIDTWQRCTADSLQILRNVADLFPSGLATICDTRSYTLAQSQSLALARLAQ